MDQNGSLYVSYENAIQRLTAAGQVTTPAENMTLAACDADAPENGRLPYLRGLAVDSRGVVYAAATGCRAVVRITGNRVETILKAERPWSPTGVAVSGDDVYVLEYTNHQGLQKEWLPRVRRIRRDGTVTTLVTISPADRARAARTPLLARSKEQSTGASRSSRRPNRGTSLRQPSPMCAC
jgi:hypothetical protein